MSTVDERLVELANVALAEVAPNEYMRLAEDGPHFFGPASFKAGLLAAVRADPDRDVRCVAHVFSAKDACALIKPHEALLGVICWRAS